MRCHVRSLRLGVGAGSGAPSRPPRARPGRSIRVPRAGRGSRGLARPPRSGWVLKRRRAWLLPRRGWCAWSGKAPSRGLGGEGWRRSRRAILVKVFWTPAGIELGEIGLPRDHSAWWCHRYAQHHALDRARLGVTNRTGRAARGHKRVPVSGLGRVRPHRRPASCPRRSRARPAARSGPRRRRRFRCRRRS